ncbi:MAG: hypothetical protein JO078_02595 [Candidatus Eremiobacteraeota bacterium]|nr:hypothetical protein [Candidatus Eremiobacteraeota bacterium]MBV9056988.1 hypothetical protein [Candidatus Eremiobacteraeota bacterium]MBV9698993.1 hypothetical protein [Candidatus Eremiobacteraeota bacterium]
MTTLNNRPLPLIAAALFVTSGCGGNAALPTSTLPADAPGASSIALVDKTSILKHLTKDVEIGSTVDPTNGDTGPRAISLVRATFGLKKGQLLVCNFDDASGNAGKGTTIDVFNPVPSSQPATFTQNAKLQGCDGDGVTAGNHVYGAGLLSGLLSQFDQTGKLLKSYDYPIQTPFTDTDAFCGFAYAPEDVYVSDSKTGSVIKVSFLPVGGRVKLTRVMTGFAVNGGSGWSVLGPSGMQYDARRTGSLCNDTLYIVDGPDSTVVAVSNASRLLLKDEIVVQPGGKKFKCAHPKATCARLVYSGRPLDGPMASALLPNGNLIVANTKGGNTLVELTPTGRILATKKLDKSSIPHVFGLLATGTSDSDTALFYTDTKTNTLQELEQ